MERVDGYVHQVGRHCGAAALRNVAAYYGWNYSEAACFGFGGGAAFVRYDDDAAWPAYRTSPGWLERACLERLGVRHLHRRGDDAPSAWANVTARVDGDDPVFLFLDPAHLPYLPDEAGHVPPHVALLVGYDDVTVEIADATAEERQTLDRTTLEAAWTSDRSVALDNEYLVATESTHHTRGNDAAAAGLRQAATYMLDPVSVERDAREPGGEGLPALRGFADTVASWADQADPHPPVRTARHCLDEHGEGTAGRALFAESLEELGQRTGLPGSLADRMADAGDTWRTVLETFDAILASEDPEPTRFETAASLVGDVADREERLFRELAAELAVESGR